MQTDVTLAAVGLTSVPVRLALAARPGTPLGDVKRAFSHPAALRQCVKRLAELKIEPLLAYDTAGAAQLVAKDASTDAAICSRRAAEAAGLEVLIDDLSDLEQNGTRFIHLRLADHARATVSFAFLSGKVANAQARLDVLTDATVLALTPTAAAPLRLWVLGADAARLQAVAPVRDVTVISLGAPAANTSHVPPKQAPGPAIPSLPHATARRAPTQIEVGAFKIGAGARAMIAGPCSVESPEQVLRIARHVAACGATAIRGGISSRAPTPIPSRATASPRSSGWSPPGATSSSRWSPR